MGNWVQLLPGEGGVGGDLTYYQFHLEVISLVMSIFWTMLAQSYVLGMSTDEAHSLLKEARLPSRERSGVWAHSVGQCGRKRWNQSWKPMDEDDHVEDVYGFGLVRPNPYSSGSHQTSTV